MMSYDRYQDMILLPLVSNAPADEYGIVDPLTNPTILKLTAFYDPVRLQKGAYFKDANEDLLKQYPALKKYDEDTSGIMIFTGTAYREYKQVESIIKAYCPNYTFEELDKDHMDTGFTSKEIAPANFRMALEYYLTDNGVEVRFPANGLSFDESTYQLDSISILPFMGAGSSDYKGYTFIPDGSGTLMRFEDATRDIDVTGKVYGADYAYQEISGSNQEVFRMPVFGVVSTTEYMNEDGPAPYKYIYEYETDANGDYVLDAFGQPKVKNKIPDPNHLKEIKKYATGFVAIVTEGDALSTITSSHGGGYGYAHPYNSAYCSFTPRPKDSYILADAISVSSNAPVVVVSKRKYTGSFKINYIMLTDPTNPNKVDGKTYYDTSYVGMAKAYRDYLESNGTISRITEDEVTNSDNTLKGIPLFIEAFGVTEVQDSFLSFPVNVKKALTTFDQLETMIDDCNKAGIQNVSFRLTGFTNGGMIPTVPTKVKFEKAAGGNKEFVEFLKYAEEKGVGVYPEFDFAYMSASGSFDGFSYSKDAVRTIDNRYITKREYTAVLQSFSTTGKICISPCVYEKYFEKFDKSFTKVLDGNTTSVSLGTLGSDLNSDFDKKEPYNREDAKNFTLDMLKRFSVDEKYTNIMVDAGNAYAMQYADVVLNAPLDSSRYAYASEAIPFFGMVYHGYVVFTGSPTNMAGDINYETLKILENGASLYMMLSYDNVQVLKEDEVLSKYYAIDYKVWKETLLGKQDPETGEYITTGLYAKLNSILKDVQTSRIDLHAFIDCNRQLTDAEKENIREDAIKVIAVAKAEAEAKWLKALNKQDTYFMYILRAKNKLINAEYSDGKFADLFDNSADLFALIDLELNDSLTLERYNELISYCGKATYNGSSETVLANHLIIDEIIKFYKNNPAVRYTVIENGVEVQKTGNELAKDWQAKRTYYAREALAKQQELGYESSVQNIMTIMDDVKVTYAEYEKYLPANEGEDSEKLTAKIEEISATYKPNLVVNDGSVVFVEYENGKWFILNYNTFVVEISYDEIVKATGKVPAGFPAEGIAITAKNFYHITTEGGNP